MPSSFSKTQIDKLGERLKARDYSDEDLIMLDEYRNSFTEAFDFVVKAIKDNLKLEVRGRPAKSTISIVDKLKREKIRLSQMQDIAGCRIVVNDILQQNEIDRYIKNQFKKNQSS